MERGSGNASVIITRFLRPQLLKSVFSGARRSQPTWRGLVWDREINQIKGQCQLKVKKWYPHLKQIFSAEFVRIHGFEAVLTFTFIEDVGLKAMTPILACRKHRFGGEWWMCRHHLFIFFFSKKKITKHLISSDDCAFTFFKNGKVGSRYLHLLMVSVPRSCVLSACLSVLSIISLIVTDWWSLSRGTHERHTGLNAILTRDGEFNSS